MKRLVILLCLSVIIAAGCKKEKNSAHNEKIQEQKISKVIPEKYLKLLKELGMTVHEGTNPPEITGIYLESPCVLYKTNIEEEISQIGKKYHDFRFEFFSQDKENFSIKTRSKESTIISQSVLAAISGSGKNFTVYSMEEINHNDNSAIFARLYSGTLEGSSIKDLKTALINVDDSNGGGIFIKEGGARIFQDEDKISERITSLDIVTMINSNKTPGLNYSYTTSIK